MFLKIRKCAKTVDHHASGGRNRDVILDELKIFWAGCCRKDYTTKGLPSLWNTCWECSLFNKTVKKQIQGNGALLAFRRKKRGERKVVS